MTGINPRRGAIAFAVLSIASLVAAYALIALLPDRGGVAWALPISYLSLGILIKYGDQAYDEGTFSRRKAFALAFPSGILLGTLMALDGGTATIAVGLLFSLMLAGKYDNRGFVAGFLVSVSISAAALLAGMAAPDPLGLVLVGAASLADEWADGKESHPLFPLFSQRPFLKVMVLLLCVAGILDSYLYFIAFLGFDFGYSFMDHLSKLIQGRAHGQP